VLVKGSPLKIIEAPGSATDLPDNQAKPVLGIFYNIAAIRSRIRLLIR